MLNSKPHLMFNLARVKTGILKPFIICKVLFLLILPHPLHLATILLKEQESKAQEYLQC